MDSQGLQDYAGGLDQRMRAVYVVIF